MSKVTSNAQSGILLPGPGALRANSIQANLITLTPEQQELVNKAKKYAVEQSIKGILSKQAVPVQPQPHKSLQRHQALVLMCRVYVGSISFELKEETVKETFAPFGAIKSINMSKDPVTLKHKGFAFVEYELPEAAQLALEHMNGKQLGGRQIKVGRPSNMPQAAPIIQQIQEECKEQNRIYVSNVPPVLSESELADLFEPFDKDLNCQLALTPNVDPPQHRGYGFIEFKTEAAALESLVMDTFDLGGQILHVCRATTPAENLSPYGTLESESNQTTASANSDEDIQLQLETANKEQERNCGSENNGSIKTEVQKIERDKAPQASETSNDVAVSLSNNYEDSVSNIIVLKNMISAEDDLDDTLQIDVYEESSKYGVVTQVVIYIDKGPQETSDDANDEESILRTSVKIFVKYKDSNGSRRAKEALDGRFFGGRKISAEHYDITLFKSSDYSK